jgi:tetratricopeptide (TPR) repeat protein
MGIAALALMGAVIAAGQAQQKKAKDKGEWELFNAATKETDPASKIAIVNAWKERYPESDYKLDRLVMLTQAYMGLKQWLNVIHTCQEALEIDPKHLNSLYSITLVTPYLNDATADVLATGEKAARDLLAAPRPATAKEEDWQRTRRNIEIAGHTTLGWIAMKRGANAAAEQELVQVLKLDASWAQISYWLGGVILGQHKTERTVDGIYQYARAAAYDGPNALPPQMRTVADGYLNKVYVQYHGDGSGLGELKAVAKNNAFPPAGFHIASAAAARAASSASVYVNSQDASERLQLNVSDGSFALVEGGQSFNGTYSVNGNTVRLHIKQLGKDVDISIDGKRLIVNGAEIWNAVENPLQPAAVTQTESEQAPEGVWVGIYGFCPKEELIIFKPTIYANQVELARLACNTYFYVAAKPGTYKFCATKGKCTTASIGTNGPYYFRVLPTTLSYSIGQVDPSVAEDELGRRRMTALDLARVLAPKMVTTSTDAAPAEFLSPQ